MTEGQWQEQWKPTSESLSKSKDRWQEDKLLSSQTLESVYLSLTSALSACAFYQETLQNQWGREGTVGGRWREPTSPLVRGGGVLTHSWPVGLAHRALGLASPFQRVSCSLHLWIFAKKNLEFSSLTPRILIAALCQIDRKHTSFGLIQSGVSNLPPRT